MENLARSGGIVAAVEDKEQQIFLCFSPAHADKRHWKLHAKLALMVTCKTVRGKSLCSAGDGYYKTDRQRGAGKTENAAAV